MARPSPSAGRMASLIHHVFLPPTLPDSQEDDVTAIDTLLVSTVGQALHELESQLPTGSQHAADIQSVYRMITRLQQTRDDNTGFLYEDDVSKALSDIFNNGGALPLPIAAQNAGVLITKHGDASPIVETFELSPPHGPITSTKGRLQRLFPGPAFSVDADTARHGDFTRALAQVLAQMSCQDMTEVKARSRRTARRDDGAEERDTRHPVLVTELLTNMFMAAGQPADVNQIRKNTRDEVMWSGTGKPWRRSAMWLLLRVALQSLFVRSTGNDDLYKCFMLFYMASLVRSFPTDQLETDVVHVLVSKMQRRISKLGEQPLRQNPWMQSVTATLKSTTDLISRRWDEIQTADQRPYGEWLSSLKTLDLDRDTRLQIPELEQYLADLRKGDAGNKKTTFTPDPSRRLPLFSADSLPVLDGSVPADYRPFQLLALEAWVSQRMGPWVQANKDTPDACTALLKCMRDYHKAAQELYTGNPESMSHMVLTLMELWAACDIAATTQCTLLQEYDHEIPGQVLQALLLPRGEQMRRLAQVEVYLHNRSEEASCQSSLFRSFGTDSSFAVRFFDESPRHHTLKKDIEKQAYHERREKVEELATKTKEYQRLQRLANTTRCDYATRTDAYGNSETVHHPDCRRHKYLAAAENLEILVHEWPLPEDALEAKSTVFELQVPKTISAWRDCTLFITHDVLGSEVPDPQTLETDYSPRVYQGLRQWAKGGAHTRLGIRSTTKPYVVTHGTSVALGDAPSQGDVCVTNGLNYCYFDTVLGIVSDAHHATDKLTDLCTYVLPSRSEALQRFLRRTWGNPHGLPPNEAIADQQACPEDMALDAFKALSSLPLGLYIQWSNILVQLSMPAVDFRQIETCLFVLQVAYHASPPGRTDWARRKGHAVLQDKAFAKALLDAVVEMHARIQDNWMAHLSLGILIWITTRLLSVTTDTDVRSRCISFLGGARLTAVGWTRLLSERAASSTRDAEREQFRGQALDVALVCISSFDVDADAFDKLPGDAIAILLECSMLVQEKKTTTIDGSDVLKVLLLARWRRILYEHREHLEKGATAGTSSPSPLDTAISKSWTTHKPGPAWEALPEPHQHWLVSIGTDVVPALHYNLLTAEFLVNGSPLARLPPDYEAHLLYRVLFGDTALEVMPSTEPGLRFAGKSLYHGHMLHFALRDADMIVCATDQETGRVWSLLPPRLLNGHLPTSFVEQHVHWVDLEGDIIEFRPIDRPWSSTLQLWSLSPVANGERQLRKHDGSTLVSIHSKTAATLHQILDPLEDAHSIHTICLPTNSSLEIELPRLGISFMLAAGSDLLECRQFRDYAIGPSQDIGTLVGLQSKLVVQHKHSSAKMVLIPKNGEICVMKTPQHHTRVTITHSTADRVQAYEIDELLGRIVDSGDLPSKLLLCYLHALTSHCLPDPLTRHAGTEQALSILESASLLSFGHLDKTSIDLLTKIAALSPMRQYYPSHFTMAQNVEWNNSLGFLAQHGRFYVAVERIFAEYETSHIFFPTDTTIFKETWDQVRKRAHRYLVERELVLSSFLRLSGFGAEDGLQRQDSIYEGRGMPIADPERRTRVYTAARLAMSDGQKHGYAAGYVPFPPDADLAATLGKLLRGSSNRESTQGPDASLGDKFIGYDGAWLKNMTVLFIRHWCRLHRLLASGSVDKYTIGVWLATLAFNPSADMQALQTLWVVFAQPAAVGQPCAPPPRPSFNLFVGREPSRADLIGVVNNALRRFDAHLSPEARTMSGASLDIQRRAYETARVSKRDAFVDNLLASWPTSLPPTPNEANYNDYINTLEAMEGVVPLFRVWHDNVLFGEYLDGLARGVQKCRVHPVSVPDPLSTDHWPPRDNGYAFVPLKSVFQSPVVVLRPRLVQSSISDINPRPVQSLHNSEADKGDNLEKLSSMFGQLHVQAKSDNERAYVDKLDVSLQSLQKYEAANRRRSGRWQPRGSTVAATHAPDLRYRLQKHLKACRENVDSLYKNLVRSYKIALPGLHQFPRLSPVVFLTHLQTQRWAKLSNEWKMAIIDYALALVALHRTSRLLALCGPGHEAEFNKELANAGHTNWNPHDHPEWLLLEVESSITIRGVQQEIAAHMMSSVAGNAVMQLNMGEGKSSVIVPMVASRLADGDRLVRVLVAKAQSKQMLQMLVAKTSGLLNRRVYHFPFARPVQLASPADALRIDRMLRDCQAQRGILLVQPEHILSFKLMGIERCMNGAVDDPVGRAMLSTQHYLDSISRDIVDESDEIFSAKFDLIYTMGIQRPTELSPSRWGLVHELLAMVANAVVTLKRQMPDAVEIHIDDTRWAGRFPRTRLLKKTAHTRLVHLVGTQLCERGLHGFPIALQPNDVRQSVFRYLTDIRLTDFEVADVETGSFWTDTTKGPLLLLRGLLAGGILAFTLGSKRWRVNYGPAPAGRHPPTQLVVPYQSKDMPSPRAEFSHPDVVLLLTSLHYYYAGLSDEALFAALHRLFNTDQPEDEYTAWVRTARSDMPPSFRQLAGVSLADRWQCTDRLFPYLRYSKGAIDYYLAHIVFPAHMKEFPDKVSASGWDLAKTGNPGQTLTNATTGFSGTNDARHLLPLSVTQLDLPQQNHTNALVLAHLLRNENAVHLLPENGAEALLTAVVQMQPPVRVLLDVGAQVLELSNLQAAQRWLQKVHEGAQQPSSNAEAVVFFDDDDLLSVVDRRGRVEPLQASPYAKHLDACLVFLDEAHTRGTDLRLPTDYRAAVTLGADLTKDRLVQACMRMRKLGHGQSVAFVVPDEIRGKMAALHPEGGSSTEVSVIDVLAWSIHETQQELHRYMPLWAMHGRRFAWQQALWSGAATPTGYSMAKPLANKFREMEALSLAQRYLPRNSPLYIGDGDHNRELANKDTLQAIDDRCRAFTRDDADEAAASLNEEQERELAPEIEEERQRARLPPATALKHAVHPDVLHFVRTGEIRQDSTAFMSAFRTLRHTSVTQLVDLDQLPALPLATIDFFSTVQPDGTSFMDLFQRTPQFVLTSTSSSPITQLLLVSPFEANELLPYIQRKRAAPTVRLHVYAARVNMAFRPLDCLDLYVVGPQSPITPSRPLAVALNLLAGQLYFQSWEEYADTAAFLGLVYQAGEAGVVAAADGFILQTTSKDHRRMALTANLQESPVAFLKVLMAQLRRQSASIDKTHVGKMLDGVLLTDADFSTNVGANSG